MKEIDTGLAFKQIKKQNGEAVAKVLRSEVLLDIPNLAHILEFAGNNPYKIKALAPVIREIYKNKNTAEYHTDKSPLALLDEAGYDAFVVTTQQQKNSIKKYYRPGEEICTLSDPERHINYHVIHAIKRGADKIKPSKNPEREDEYGTSVISIQIAKTGGFISIKNRYNHTVNNPDATFNNNPDNIIPGLSTSLKKYFDVNFNTSQSVMPDNFRILHDQFVYFNYEVNNTYFGPDYYFSGSTIKKLNSDYEVMMDYYILNIKTGTVQDIAGLNDSTYKIFQDIFRNKKITVRTSPNHKHKRMIYADDTHVLSVEKGEITELNLPTIKNIGDAFLKHNKRLKKIYAPKLESVGHDFLEMNEQLTELDLPSLKTVEHNFVSDNTIITKFNAPLLEKTGSCFLKDNRGLTILELPSLRILEAYGLRYNVSLSKLYVPKLEKIGYGCLTSNRNLTELDLPNVRIIKFNFLGDNKDLAQFNAPKLEKIGNKVMSKNQNLTELILPSLQEVGNNFLFGNKKLKTFRAPKLKTIGEKFLASNTELTDFVVENKDMLHENISNRRLIMILAKNKLKQKLKDNFSKMLNTLTHNQTLKQN